jgi:hypothetical protein
VEASGFLSCACDEVAPSGRRTGERTTSPVPDGSALDAAVRR